jgi:hypothetical protein
MLRLNISTLKLDFSLMHTNLPTNTAHKSFYTAAESLHTAKETFNAAAGSINA